MKPQQAEDTGVNPRMMNWRGSEERAGKGNGTPLKNSCLQNPWARGAWQAALHGGETESDTTEVT